VCHDRALDFHPRILRTLLHTSLRVQFGRLKSNSLSSGFEASKIHEAHPPAIKKNREAIIDASKKVRVEVNVERTKYVYVQKERDH
jgi:hypothetical protein